MTRKLTILLSAFVLTFFISGVSMGQQKEKHSAANKVEVRNLGKTYAVNLVTEPSEDPEGFTIMTAAGHFMFNSLQEKEGERTALSFQGDVHLAGKGLALVTYNVSCENGSRATSQQINLGGSVLLGIGSQVLIAKSKGRTFKLKITVAK